MSINIAQAATGRMTLDVPGIATEHPAEEGAVYLLLVVRYDNHDIETKHFTDFQFIGANDPGASTAWMAMSRAVSTGRPT